MKEKEVKKFADYIKEATETTTTTTTDANVNAMQSNTVAYNKYKSRVVSMFNGAKPEDVAKISESFENFINGLPEAEKGASDMLRALFSTEKIKLTIKGLEDQKKVIENEIAERMKDLKQISDNLT